MAGQERWWLRGEGGFSRPLNPGGLLIGRSPHCDVVLRDEHASRRHALVYLSEEGPVVMLLGRGPATVNGEATDSERALEDGDELSFPGIVLTVVRDGATQVPSASPTIWLLEAPDGALHSMNRSPYVVGGGDDDDLRVDGWPAQAVQLLARGDLLEARTTVTVTADGKPLTEGDPCLLRVGSVLTYAGAELKIATGGQLGHGSTVASEPGGVTKVHLEFLPRGGRLHVTVDGQARAVFLTDRRCDLIAVLLSPPPPDAAGDFVEDEIVLTRVWGKGKLVDRTHLNVLIHRVRKDLVRAELDGSALIQRAEGGGATRFCLARGARVSLE